MFQILERFKEAARERRQKIVQEKALTTLTEIAVSAIRSDTGDVTVDLLRKVESLTGKDFSAEQKRNILIAAIERDDPELFKAVHDSVAGGHMGFTITFQHSAGPEGPYYIDTFALLPFAISKGAVNVAMAIACHPDTDVTQAGTSWSSSKQDRPNTSPLELAKRAGYTELRAVILDRLAEQHTKRSKALRREAAGLRLQG